MPEPEAVNLFCYEIFNFNLAFKEHGMSAVVHCTHGFNRTGACSLRLCPSTLGMLWCRFSLLQRHLLLAARTVWAA